MKVSISKISNANYNTYRREHAPSFGSLLQRNIEQNTRQSGSSFWDKLSLIKQTLEISPEAAILVAANVFFGSDEETETSKESEKTSFKEETPTATVEKEPEKKPEHTKSNSSGYYSSYRYDSSSTYSSSDRTTEHTQKTKHTSPKTHTKRETTTNTEVKTAAQEKTVVQDTTLTTAQEKVNVIVDKMVTQKAALEKIKESINKSAQKFTEVVKKYNEEQLINARKTYKQLLKQYKELCGNECDHEKFFANWHSWDLKLLLSKTSELREEISYQEMVLNAAKALRKGPDSYVPTEYRNVFDLSNLREIVPNTNNRFNYELNRMCKIFLENSTAVDRALVAFNRINKIYTQEAAIGIKEIFDLQKDKKMRLLERIPKLGLIPKALRVADQIKLTKCIMSDFKDLTTKYVEGGIAPFMRKYNEQYAQILKYFDDNKATIMYGKYSKNMLKIIEEAKKKRLQADYKIMNSYSSNGMNISNICNKVKRKGLFDVARKTVITFASFF